MMLLQSVGIQFTAVTSGIWSNVDWWLITRVVETNANLAIVGLQKSLGFHGVWLTSRIDLFLVTLLVAHNTTPAIVETAQLLS